jgi:curved DNA-binding protein CbpA
LNRGVGVPRFDSTKDYYQVLGVDSGASAVEIDRAFRIEARKRHPDGGGSEEEMKLLNEAHDVLSDDEERKAYDTERNPPRPAYGSSVALDPEVPAAGGGTLKIPVTDEDFAGLIMGAVACFGLGLPLWLLVEMQWMFFLWPLRLISLGAVGLGILTGNAALSARQRRLRKSRGRLRAGTAAFQRAVYWGAVALLVALMIVFYSA